MAEKKAKKTKMNLPKDVFLHLLNILTFYLSVVSFITLYIQYINALFPDPLNFYFSGIADAVRTFTSILVISFPVYLLTSWLLGKDLKKNPPKREFTLRKWLIYFILFAAAITIIIDLIILVNHFLSGELTLRFILKVFTVLLVAAAVFYYYIWDLRRKDKEISGVPKKLAYLASLAALASVAAGFFIVGTPAEQRKIRFDEQRISDLQVIQDQIINYWTRKEVLPQNLSELEDNISGFFVPQDPETKAQYGYKVKDTLSFELCAEFKTSSKKINSAGKGRIAIYPYYEAYSQNWEHEVGEKCFERTIDPELYKADRVPKTPAPALP